MRRNRAARAANFLKSDDILRDPISTGIGCFKKARKEYVERFRSDCTRGAPPGKRWPPTSMFRQPHTETPRLCDSTSRLRMVLVIYHFFLIQTLLEYRVMVRQREKTYAEVLLKNATTAGPKRHVGSYAWYFFHF